MKNRRIKKKKTPFIKPKLNEATLEERIGSVLKKTFPTFHEMNVKHQESFSIKFGHHNVKVDSKYPSEYPNRAIYDILLTTEDGQTNLILLELKREGLGITVDDIEQGLSYARLVHPMPPITLISNGKENIFYNTYSKKVIKDTTVDFKQLKSLIDNSFSLAIDDFKHTIDILLNRNPCLIGQIINDISKSRFEKLKGNISDFTKPICERFIVKREIVQELNKQFGNKNLIGLIGPAFSGKTNILYDFFKSFSDNNNAMYYIDCKDSNYSIFQHLANHFSKELNYSINKDKIREWLILSLNKTDNVSFAFLLDNIDSNLPQNVKDEIAELIDILEGSKHSIIFTIDLINYNILAKDKYRNYLTLFGVKTLILNINELTLSEFEGSYELLFDIAKSYFEHGAYFAIEYRHPRILRLLAAKFSQNSQHLVAGQALRIIAVPDYELLKFLANNNSFNHDLRSLHKKLARAFILDRIKNNDITIILASHFGGISLSSIEEVFGDDISSLLISGFITKHELSNGVIVLYPKISELIALYGIEQIALILTKNFKDKSVEETYKNFEKLCMPFINSDIVGTGVLFQLANDGHIDLFSTLVQYMQSLKPKKDKLNDGTTALMLLDEKRHVNITFEGDSEEGLIGNYFPYLVLSQIAGYPLRLEDSNDEDEYDFHLGLILDIALSPVPIFRVSNFSFKNIPPYNSYTFKEVGSVICGMDGVIEPIVQSIQKCFFSIPDQIERLYDYAFDQKLFSVIWRIYLALRNETSNIDDNLAKKAEKFMNRFNNEFSGLMDEIIDKQMDNNINT